MPDLELTLPDGSKKKIPAGTKAREVVEQIGARLAQAALAVKLDDAIVELERPLDKSGNFRVLTWNDLEGKQALWHTAAHVLAEAVTALYPTAQPTIGPPLDEGFYYDFDVEKPFSEDDLAKIEKRMNEIIAQNRTIVRHEVKKEEALEKFKSNPYKQELIHEFTGAGKTLSIYSQGAFYDLCRGGHVEQTGRIKALKLLKTSSAYWRADQSKASLQRIYGIAFPEKKMLDEYLTLKEEAEKNSHLLLGKEMDLFTISPLIGKGLPLWTPKGTYIRQKLEEFMREEQFKQGYLPIITPHIARVSLYETSGHYPHYKESMYAPIEIENENYILKPMNCPFHIQVYASRRRSYRDLPLRFAEFGTVYRFEKSGELTGLLRVRGFTQDDAHLFVTPDQIQAEFGNIYDLVIKVLNTFGMNRFRVRLGLRDPKSDKYIGSAESWDRAESDIEKVLIDKNVEYFKAVGEAAFYGPKTDILVKDSLNREWQLGTIQLDNNLPERFNLAYIGSDDQPHRPVMIHRAPFGSMERFTAVLIEHYKGIFPPWLAPTPVRIMPLSDPHYPYAQKIKQQLMDARIPCDIDHSNNTLSYRIREAQLERIPIMIVVGKREEDEQTVTIRLRDGTQKPGYPLAQFLAKTVSFMQNRSAKTDY